MTCHRVIVLLASFWLDLISDVVAGVQYLIDDNREEVLNERRGN